MYFGVVCCKENLGILPSHPGSTTGDSMDEVVAKALAIKQKLDDLNARHGRERDYKIFVGKVEKEVIVTPNYTLVDIK